MSIAAGRSFSDNSPADRPFPFSRPLRPLVAGFCLLGSGFDFRFLEGYGAATQNNSVTTQFASTGYAFYMLKQRFVQKAVVELRDFLTSIDGFFL